jgi:hypothetical protein
MRTPLTDLNEVNSIIAAVYLSLMFFLVIFFDYLTTAGSTAAINGFGKHFPNILKSIHKIFALAVLQAILYIGWMFAFAISFYAIFDEMRLFDLLLLGGDLTVADYVLTPLLIIAFLAAFLALNNAFSLSVQHMVTDKMPLLKAMDASFGLVFGKGRRLKMLLFNAACKTLLILFYAALFLLVDALFAFPQLFVGMNDLAEWLLAFCIKILLVYLIATFFVPFQKSVVCTLHNVNFEVKSDKMKGKRK